MKLKSWTLETLAIFLLFAAGLGMRLVHLGAAPLTDLEAGHALQALNLARGTQEMLGDQPGYNALTAPSFALLGDGDFLARFWPALIGSLIVLVPAFFRKALGRRGALLLGVFLAFEPGLLAVSRTADSAILAVVFLLLGVGAYRAGKPALAGIAGALALLGGSMFWEGLIILAIAAWLSGLRPFEREVATGESESTLRLRSAAWILGTLVAVGSLLFTAPVNLGGIFNALAGYVKGWAGGYEISPLLLAFSLLVYQPLGLLLGTAGIIHALRRKDAVDLFLSRWLLVALVLVLFYPGHTYTDLVWVVLPLWALAARQAARWLDAPVLKIDQAPAWGLALLIAILGVFIWLSLSGLVSNTNWLAGVEEQSNAIQIYFARILISVALMLLTTILIAWGWSYRASLRGVLVGFVALLAFYGAAAGVHAAGLGRNPQNELWRTDTHLQDARLLRQTIDDLSLANTGQRGTADLLVAGFDQPGLRWALRDLPRAQFEAALPRQGQPEMILTPLQDDLGLAEAYRGQDFRWQVRPLWMELTAREWLNWVIFRDARIEAVGLMLWTRTDLFPGGQPAN